MKDLKEELRTFRFGQLTILQWMAVLALVGISIHFLMILFG